ncbi:MAG: Hpt domain-containing protein [Bryobacteraceae bacterium]|nr:Hpt domain-containing protein [Bryobacteraceae bacterium]MDW8379083.1 Hpt domain-containing protein [Bryobacterales bacterium]
MTTNLDPEIIAGFVKEVESYLPKLLEQLERFRANPERMEELEEAHRLAHGIRGAGATLGLFMLSQLAKYQEDTLEQILQGQIRWNDEVGRLLEAATLETGALLQGMVSGEIPDRSALERLIRSFRRLMALPESEDPQAIEHFFNPTAEESLQPGPDSSCEVPFDAGASSAALGDGSSLMQTLDEPQADEELWAAFSEESAGHFQILAESLEKLRGGAEAETLKAVRRSFHQLKGASGVVGLRNTSKICAAAQKLLDAIHEGEAEYQPGFRDLLERAFEIVLEAIGGRGTGAGLQQRAQALQSEFEEALAGCCVPPPQAANMLNSQAVSLVPESPSRVNFEDSVEAGDELWDAFQQEAEEHLNSISELLRQAEISTPSSESIQAMRRSVHTFKGACGVVGMRLTAALAHRMEDLLDALYEGRLAYSPEFTPLLFATFDLFSDAMSLRGLPEEAAPAVKELLDRYQAVMAAVPSLEPGTEAAPAAQNLPATAVEALPSVDSEERRAAFAEASNLAEEVRKSAQFLRVPVERVDELVRLVSELVIHRSRFEQYLGAYVREVDDLQLSIERLSRISRKLQSDYEAVWLKEANRRAVYASAPSRSAAGTSSGLSDDFDALEFDRYTEFHLLSRDLAETSGDMNNTGSRLSDLIADFEGYLNRLGQLTSEVEEKLMRLRMLPLRHIASRIHRTVRVTAERLGKPINFVLEGEEVEIDKTAIEELAGPLDHILRNAIDHGIEPVAERLAAQKPEHGNIWLRASHERSQVVIQIRDDGRGLDPEKLRQKALQAGLVSREEAKHLNDSELFNLIFLPGFSTASELSEISGRGVGLDVVKATVSKMRGTLSVSSELGKGTTFTIRLPITQALTRVVLVRSGSDTYAIPLSSIFQVLRVEPEQMELVGRRPMLRLGANTVTTIHLSEIVGQPAKESNLSKLKAIVLAIGEQRLALLVDQVLEAREVVVKPLSGMLGRVYGVIGATLMGDGSVVLVLNPNDMLQHTMGQHFRLRTPQPVAKQASDGLEVLVVDDSPSVRRVVANLLRHAGWTPHTAKDGLDALELLHSGVARPDVVLLDIEMPRMDGYEFTATLRSMPLYRNVPVVMLTSRAGEKHRKKAIEVGATAYMIKPYQDEELLTTVRHVVQQARQAGKR